MSCVEFKAKLYVTKVALIWPGYITWLCLEFGFKIICKLHVSDSCDDSMLKYHYRATAGRR